MAYEEKSKPNVKPHAVSLTDRCKMSVTGVEDVENFDETAIVMRTSQGDLIVRGSGLHIGKINLDVGEMQVEGLISEFSYEERSEGSGGFWSKIFG